MSACRDRLACAAGAQAGGPCCCAYEKPEEVDSLVTAPTTDQLIVLVTNGNFDIEGRYAGRWRVTSVSPD
jgi:hypothetical protein